VVQGAVSFNSSNEKSENEQTDNRHRPSTNLGCMAENKTVGGTMEVTGSGGQIMYTGVTMTGGAAFEANCGPHRRRASRGIRYSDLGKAAVVWLQASSIAWPVDFRTQT
jgi:hypothetical protein